LYSSVYGTKIPEHFSEVYEMTRRIWEMPFDEVRDYLDNGRTGVVIPVGTVEPHGPHLPMGTDNLLAQSIGEVIAERFDWLIAPTLNYGLGFLNVVINNGHGGNTQELYQIAKDLTRVYPVARIIVIDWWGLDASALEKVYKGKTAGHAGIDETAAVIYFHNDLVHPEKFTGENDYWVNMDGFKAQPLPASCILQDEKSVPDFDKKRADDFMKELLETICGKVSDALKRWAHNFGD
jgi:creatinine amidohydrolase